MDELFEQSRNIFVGDPAEAKKFTKQIAFNAIPHTDVFLDDGPTKEDWKMMLETKRKMNPQTRLTATSVRVPVFVALSIPFILELTNRYYAQKELRKSAVGEKGV